MKTLMEKADELHEALCSECFAGIPFAKNAWEAYSDNSYIWDEPLIEDFAKKAKEYFEALGYEVACYEEKIPRYEDERFIFVVATNLYEFEEVKEYIEAKEIYEEAFNTNTRTMR